MKKASPPSDGDLVVVDGSNLATEGRSLPSLAQLNEAVLSYREEYPDVKSPSSWMPRSGTASTMSEVAEFDAAVDNNELVAPPAGAVGRGDAFVLTIANKSGDRHQQRLVPGVPRRPTPGSSTRVASWAASRCRRRLGVRHPCSGQGPMSRKARGRQPADEGAGAAIGEQAGEPADAGVQRRRPPGPARAPWPGHAGAKARRPRRPWAAAAPAAPPTARPAADRSTSCSRSSTSSSTTRSAQREGHGRVVLEPRRLRHAR